MKTCKQCKETKTLDKFGKDSGNKDGLLSKCKSCYKDYHKKIYIKNKALINARSKKWKMENSLRRKEVDKIWSQNNKEHLKNKNKTWRINNKDHVKIQGLKYRQENKEKRKSINKIWTKTNSAKCNANLAKRRAAKLKATPNWLTKDQLKEIEQFYIDAKECQWLSEDKLEVDHIVPLQGENVCGLHVPWNLRVIPASKNRSKKNKLEP